MKLIFLSLAAAFLTTVFAQAETQIGGDGHAIGVSAVLDATDTARLTQVFRGKSDLYWETSGSPAAGIFGRTSGYKIFVNGRVVANDFSPRTTRWSYEWCGPFVATNEFMDHGDSSDASQLFNLMSDKSSPGFEVKSTRFNNCQIHSKTFVTTDKRALLYCQTYSCTARQNATGAYCTFSTVSDAKNLAVPPKVAVKKLNASVSRKGLNPLVAPALRIFRNEELGLEFTSLLGEAQWQQSNAICAARGEGWRLPKQMELEQLARTSISKIPAEIFGRKCSQSCVSGTLNNGGPVYVKLEPVFSYINLAFDEKQAVTCVKGL